MRVGAGECRPELLKGLNQLRARYGLVGRAVTEIDEHFDAIIHQGADLVLHLRLLDDVMAPLSPLQMRPGIVRRIRRLR